jgi:uncharacterized membrane protein
VTWTETILKSFPFATFFIVLLVIILKNEHAVAIYEMAAHEMGISNAQLSVVILVVFIILGILWKVTVHFLEAQKEAVEKQIVDDIERAALIRLFEATGNFQ